MALTITIPGAVEATIGATAPAVLTVGVGTPGATGPAGQGVPVGGTAGQFLTKIDGTNYNTDWTTVNLSQYAVKANNLSDLASASTARTNLGLGTMATATAADYSTTTVANGLYYPLTGNPSGFITSSALTGYATESFVTSQGYLTVGDGGTVPAGGTTGQILAKASSSDYSLVWESFIPGDRYLTTSTTSNTISNGAKTFTVDTGLSYTTQQDVTIAADPANHMHAVVTTYDSGSGVLVVDVKTHTGSGIHVSWTVNVGGTVPALSVAWGDITGTIGSQSDLATELNAKFDHAGGAIDPNGSVTASDTSTATDSELAGWGLGVQLTADHTKGTTVEFDGLDAYDGASHMQVTPTGLTFPDSTTQTTAGLTDAPSDGSTYGRQDGAWVVAGGGGGVPEAPTTGTQYARKNGSWVNAGNAADGYFPFFDITDVQIYTNTDPEAYITCSLSGSFGGPITQTINSGEINIYFVAIDPSGNEIYSFTFSTYTSGGFSINNAYAGNGTAYSGNYDLFLRVYSGVSGQYTSVSRFGNYSTMDP